VVGASVFVSVFTSCFVSVLVSVFTSGVAIGVGAELWAIDGVGAIAGEDGIVGADMLEAGFRGDTGDAGFVVLVIDFLQLSDVVTQAPNIGCPYGFGQVEERVWVMLPV